MTTSVSIRRIDPKREGQARYYEIDGRRYPSVTSILQVVAKPALIPWAKNVALDKVRQTLLAREDLPTSSTYEWWVNEILQAASKRPDEVRDAAADFGTRSHHLVEAYLKGAMPEIPPELHPPFDAFVDWQKQAGFSIAASEQVVWSTVHGYAGTMDIRVVGTDNLFGTEMTAVVDIKTSNGIWDEHKMQLAAYAKALEERTGKRVEKGIILRLGKTKPEFEAHELSRFELNRWFGGFKGALALWQAKA